MSPNGSGPTTVASHQGAIVEHVFASPHSSHPSHTVRFMAIPQADGRGVLPVGTQVGEHYGDPVYRGHDATMDEVKDRFVTKYRDSETRARLFAELEQIVIEVKRHIPNFNLMISGSFVFNDTDPTSIFVGFDALASEIDKLDGHSAWLLDRLCCGQEWEIGDQTVLSISVEIMLQYEAEHSLFDLFSTERMLQFYMASYVNDIRRPNGYIEVFVAAEKEVRL